jgi:hypothetical protein
VIDARENGDAAFLDGGYETIHRRFRIERARKNRQALDAHKSPLRFPVAFRFRDSRGRILARPARGVCRAAPYKNFADMAVSRR